MNAADCSAASPHPAALLGFKRFYPSQVSSPRRTTMAFPQRRPRVSFDQPVPAPTVFVGRPVHPAPASFVRRPASPNRGCDCSRLGGLISRRRSDRSDSSRSIDPALGFVLLQGCGRVGHCCVGTTSAILARNIRGLVTAGDSSVPGPLVTGPSAPGFAAPFLRRCDRNLVRLHPLARSRFSLAPASPALQRFVRLTPRQSNRSEPRWNQLPV